MNIILTLLLFLFVIVSGLKKPSAKQLILQDEDIFIPYQGERLGNLFDWNLCKLLTRKYRENILISPVSLKLALVLLYEGAQDDTAFELASAMQLPVGQWATRDRFSLILRSLQPVGDEYKLNLGNRIYIQNSITVKQSYAAIVKTFYQTDIVISNFSNSQATVNDINSWVSKLSNGNINNLIEDENSIKDSLMVLMNVLYFKGNWYKNIFSTNATEVDKFHETFNKTVDVKFMNAVGNFYYTESSEFDAKILRIPYAGQKFAIYFILPRFVEGLDYLLRNINPFLLTKHIWSMRKLPVDVKIPKFKFDFVSHLEPVLRELGIREIFEENAILTGIAKTKRYQNLKVSDIIQKTGIELNEEGTTAFAATEINVGNKIAEQVFHATHPFLFYIEDEKTGTILYMGRVNNPLETSSSTEAPGRKVVDASSSTQVTVDKQNEFNADLLQSVSKQSDNNVLVSPLSVKLAMMMMVEGTGGATRDELLAALKVPSDLNESRNMLKETVTYLTSINDNSTEISLGNRLWVNNGTEISDQYSRLLGTYYQSGVQSVAFHNPIKSAIAINQWVGQTTRRHITSAVDAASLQPETQMLLTSVVYFKGMWDKAFDKGVTGNRCFYIPNQGCKEVPMMENTATYPYADIPFLKAEVIELPYKDSSLSMLVMLPASEGYQGLEILTRDLSHASLSSILQNLKDTEITIQLPKFKIESKINLRPVLESMGIKNLFTNGANITGISLKRAFNVGKVIHNAKIEVDEEGTVAAAVTVLEVLPLMGSINDVFRADRPFLFQLIDRKTNSILFSGRVIEPLT